jgi:hypothetical protein
MPAPYPKPWTPALPTRPVSTDPPGGTLNWPTETSNSRHAKLRNSEGCLGASPSDCGSAPTSIPRAHCFIKKPLRRVWESTPGKIQLLTVRYTWHIFSSAPLRHPVQLVSPPPLPAARPQPFLPPGHHIPPPPTYQLFPLASVTNQD